jgi:hypothetical protein
MVDSNLTEIVAILDRSGSMHSLKSDTIGGFNNFIAEQKKTAGKAILTRVQFDNQYQVDFEGKDINEVEDLNDKTYVPRGSTALLDAVGRTINVVGARLSSLPEEKRPGQVIFLIITDGHENASREFSASKVKEMVKHQSDVYKWSFVFLGGGDIDSQKEQGASIGISSNNVYGYSATSVGTRALYNNISKGVSRRRADLSLSLNSPDASLLTPEESKELTK